jgi:cell division protein FtsZ
MLEIQDAARVITESIDPQARVIFGAIKDDKLKKNELKVTVIATGFPEESDTNNNYNIARRAPSITEPKKEEPEPEEPGRGRIFNSLPKKTESPKSIDQTPTTKTNQVEPPKREPKPVDPADDNDEDDDDWGAVPAFLRRSKLK